MEYTKDMILHVCYGEASHSSGSKKKKWTSRVLEKIKRRKWITTAILSAIVFISIDMVLVSNFVHILNMV